ncbi:hypothetical protein CQW23_01854 [Capsicum baccatum]|uniref:Uncharacterized protein n=1 Tax=Capsicum baccatum TaxID=33114 RepID=A0A2G2XQ67_CAPBA|nr:hypothetical protein CQW23_01854 [Capsicum baccatum]
MMALIVAYLDKINFSTQIVEKKESFRTSNALDIVSKYDVVVDGTDNAPSHYMINDCCIVLRKVMDIVDRLFVAMFDSLNVKCKKELEAIGRQYPFEPLKYGTEFYILYKYPQAVRPFYTIPCHENPSYNNSFDVFIEGEEIISGAQRVHVHEFLEKRAGVYGIDVKTI